MGILPKIDPDGLLEYSVVFSDRSLNQMSNKFKIIMREISNELKNIDNSNSVVILPGGGTFGMEAIARQFGNDEKCLIIRNGWFGFRWSEVLEKEKLHQR